MAISAHPLGAYSSILQDCRSVAIFVANGIGDIIFALPTLRALCEGFQGNVTLIVEEGRHRFLYDELKVRKIVYMRNAPNPDDRRIFDVDHLISSTFDVDLFIALVPWKSSHLESLAARLQPCVTIGFFKNYHIHIPLDESKHDFDLQFSTVKCIFPNRRIDDFAYAPVFQNDVEIAGQKLLSAIPSHYRRVALHLESYSSEKSIDHAKCQQLIKSILEYDNSIIILYIGTLREALIFEEIDSRVVVLNDLSLALAMNIVSHADAFIGVDSCMLHVADLARVPSLGIFGPTSSNQFGIRFAERRRHINVVGPATNVSIVEVLGTLSAILD